MTAARTNSSKWMAPEVANVMFQRSLAVGLLFGVASLILAFFPSTRTQFFHSYLIGFILWLGVSLGSMALLMIQHLTGGAWGMVIRRQLEAAMKVLPLMGFLMIPIFFGMKSLYIWADKAFVAGSGDKHLQELANTYLTVGGSAHFLFLDGFIGRAVFYFAVWFILAGTLSRWSGEQDFAPVQNRSPRFRKIAAPGLILYAFTISFAVIDWVMSLDPHWISTIFGFIMIVGECLSALCVMVIVENLLSREEPVASWLKPKEVHDHGKLILAFVMLWAYFGFSQFLIIWAGNLPMEIRFFLRRLNHGWGNIALLLVAFQFALPFLFLLSRPFKRNPRRLVRLAYWLLLMRLVDLCWYVEPTFSQNLTFRWGYLQDLMVPVAIGSLWMAYFFHNLRRRPLLPEFDLHAQEFLEYAGVAHD